MCENFWSNWQGFFSFSWSQFIDYMAKINHHGALQKCCLLVGFLLDVYNPVLQNWQFDLFFFKRHVQLSIKSFVLRVHFRNDLCVRISQLLTCDFLLFLLLLLLYIPTSYPIPEPPKSNTKIWSLSLYSQGRLTYQICTGGGCVW